jgi:hypothetical protein
LTHKVNSRQEVDTILAKNEILGGFISKKVLKMSIVTQDIGKIQTIFVGNYILE